MPNVSRSDTRRAYGTDCCGIPMTTFTATCLALSLYLLVGILIMSLDCPFNRNVVYFFVFVMLAITGLCAMAGINMMYPRYRFNCLSLSVSLLYSASAGYIFLGLIMSAMEGLCKPPGTPDGSLFTSKVVGNYFIWFITVAGLLFQIVAHYYYG